MYAEKTKYCPNCGARMVEPQESEKVNCKSTKCDNCINHNYCDFEQQESEEPTGMSDAVLEHYRKLAEHYNGGTHEPI